MQSLLITIHLMAVIGLVGVVLLQKSEGGALGMGGGAGGVFSSRGAANVLTRATAILAMIFFSTTIGLAIIADRGSERSRLIDLVPNEATAPLNSDTDLLDGLNDAPAAPSTGEQSGTTEPSAPLAQ